MKYKLNFITQLPFDRQLLNLKVEATTGTESTFAEMTEKSVKCALWLREQGIRSGDIIGICTHNHLESYVPLLGALYIGAISNPWDNDLSPSTLYVSLQRVSVIARVAREH